MPEYLFVHELELEDREGTCSGDEQREMERKRLQKGASRGKVAGSREAEGRKVEEEEEKEEREVQERYRERKWWKKGKKVIESVSSKRVDKNREEKGSKGRTKRPRVRQTWKKLGKWFFLLLILGQNWLSVSAASGRAKKEYRGHDKDAAKSADQRKQLDRGGSEKVESKSEEKMKMNKDAGKLRCNLVNGSSWSA